MSDHPRVEAVIEHILHRLGAGPAQFYDLLVELEDVEYRDILLAWGRVRERIRLERDEQGRYLLPSAERAPVRAEPEVTMVVERM